MSSTQQRFYLRQFVISGSLALAVLLAGAICLGYFLRNDAVIDRTDSFFFPWGPTLLLLGGILLLTRAVIFCHHYLYPPLWPLYYGESKDETWCCYFLKGRYHQAGQPGLTFLVHRDKEGQPCFFLLFKPRDAQPSAIEPTHSRKPGACTVQRLCYCPCCGKDLEKWYRDKVDALARPDLVKEVEAHLPLATPPGPHANAG